MPDEPTYEQMRQKLSTMLAKLRETLANLNAKIEYLENFLNTGVDAERAVVNPGQYSYIDNEELKQVITNNRKKEIKNVRPKFPGHQNKSRNRI